MNLAQQLPATYQDIDTGRKALTMASLRMQVQECTTAGLLTDLLAAKGAIDQAIKSYFEESDAQG